MGRPARMAFIFTLCITAISWTTIPALAKGPSQGVITGPGLSAAIRLREPGARRIGRDLARVVVQSGFFLGLWGGGHPLAQRPPGDLGPRYTVTYTMRLAGGRSDPIVQYVFPYAEPVPVTLMPAKQQYWGSNETVGGWYAARDGFRATLTGLGLQVSATSWWAAEIGMVSATIARRAGPIPTWFLAATVVLILALAAILRARSLRHAHRVGVPGITPP